jgi:hypothetical protein
MLAIRVERLERLRELGVAGNLPVKSREFFFRLLVAQWAYTRRQTRLTPGHVDGR